MSETTTFIVDVGSHMKDSHLETGLRYIQDIVANKVFKDLKTDVVSLIAVNTEKTINKYGVENVSIIHSIKKPSFEDLKLYNINPTESKVDGDGIIKAIAFSFYETKEFLVKKKWKRNIFVITNSLETPELDDEMLSGISKEFIDTNTKLIIVGVDFNDENLSSIQKSNISLWQNLQRSTPDSIIITQTDIQSLLDSPPPKPYRPTKLFEVQLRIGADLVNDGDWKSFVDDQSCLCFNVEGYSAVKPEKPLTRKIYGLDTNGKAQSIISSTDYEIHNYHDEITDDLEFSEEDFDKLYDVEVVDPKTLVNGYKYGKSIVVLNELLTGSLKYKSSPGIDIRGIVESKKFPRQYLTSEAIFLIPGKNSKNDFHALGAFVDALTELQSFAIARLVKKPNQEVQMCVLIPVYISKNGGVSTKRKIDDESLIDSRALIMTRLPFLEDEKLSNFPDLTQVRTTSGKIIFDDKLSPSKDVEELMDSLVSKMDLDKLQDEETDFANGKRIFNSFYGESLLPIPGSHGNHDILVKPAIGVHRVSQVLKDITINSSKYKGGFDEYLTHDNIIPPLNETFKRLTQPDPQLLKLVKDELEELGKILDVKPVDKSKVQKRKRRINDEVLNDDENFEELSLEELLMRGAK